MALKSALALHVGFWVYLLFGGSIFYWLETTVHSSLENSVSSSSDSSSHFCSHLVDTVNRTLESWDQSEDLTHFLEIMAHSCRNLSAQDNSTLEPTETTRWDFSSALFLSMTIVTTIGYGNWVPITASGKIFCIIYGFLGIPLAGILLASTSDYFSNHLLTLYNRQRKEHNEKLAIAVAAIVYLVPGLLIFLFIPAGIFTVLEGWSYLDAFYFSFVTLTTIGFGDLVAAQRISSSWIWFYRVSAIGWVIIGLGYWAMIVAFITKAFKSKELRVRWHRTTIAIAHQAEEMRKAVEHLSVHPRDDFLAHKSKAVFEFILQLAGSVGQFGGDVDQRLSIPGIATAFKPRGSSHMAIHSLLELPILFLGRNQVLPTQTDGASADSNANRTCLETFRSPSEDSGFEDIRNEAQRALMKSKSGSSTSLPIVTVSDAVRVERPKNLLRSQTRPELFKRQNSKLLKELLLEAAVILNEVGEPHPQ